MIIRTIQSLILLLFSQFILSQEHSERQLKKISSDIVKDSNSCLLISLDSLGNPRARLMDSYMPNDNFVFYLITNSLSRKVKELENDSRVVLSFQSLDGKSYVTVSGFSVLSDDKKLKEKYWKDSWTPHYRGRDVNSLLIKVIPKSLEVISIPKNVSGDPVTWKPKTIFFN